MSKVRTITVNALARVEGEGGLAVRVRNGTVQEVRLDIYEPPRFFEAFLRGRAFGEAPDLTARICGICPVAYQMSSVHALEAACGADPGPRVRELRRLLYCGEWIESHVLHVAMLHAPDFLGYESALHMAKDHPDAVTLSLRLKKAGNEIVTAVGGREIHPVNVRVGGFYRAPSAAELSPLVPKLETARGEAAELLRWASTFDFPELDLHHELVSLRHPSEYPLNEGRIVSSEGLDIAASAWEDHFEEEHVAAVERPPRAEEGRRDHPDRAARPVHASTSTVSPRRSRTPRGKRGSAPECRNPFRSILVRCVETLWAVDEALRILRAYAAARAVLRRGRAARRSRSRRDGGAARPSLPPLPHRRRRAHRRGAHRPADGAEPPGHGSRPARLRPGPPRPRGGAGSRSSPSRSSATTTRASRARLTS